MTFNVVDIPEIYKNKLKIPIILAIVLLFLISMLALTSIFSLKTKIREGKKQYLIEMTSYRAGLVRERIDEDFNNLNSFSQIISSEKHLSKKNILNMLIIENDLNKFKRMGIIDLEGNVLTTDNKSFNVKDRTYFQDILNGKEQSFSSLLIDKGGGNEISVLAVPIHKSLNSKELDGILFATIKRDEYSRILYLPSLNTDGYNYIVKTPLQKIEYSDEKYNQANKNLNLPEISEILDKYGAKKNPNMRKKGKNRESGIFEGKIKDKKFYISYAPVGFNNWYVLNIVPRESFSKEFSQLLYIVFGFALLLFVVMMLLFISYLRVFTGMFQSERLLKQINSTISRTFILGKIKKVIVNEVGKMFNADSCIIKDYDEYTNTFSSNRLSEYFKDNDKFLYDPMKLNNNNFDRTVLTLGGVEINDLSQFMTENNLENDEFSKSLRAVGFFSGIRLPIIYNNHILGLLCLSYRSKHVFTGYEKELLNTISEQIAMAIKQANLYAQTIQNTKQEKLLKEILSLSKSDLELSETFPLICEKIANTLDISGVKLVKILDFNRNDFENYSYIKNKNTSTINSLEIKQQDIKYWTEQTKNGQIQIITDIQNSELPEDIKKYYLLNNLKSITCVPIKFINSHLYIFIANHSKIKQWSEQNIETLYMLQDYIAILLKEKDLYNEEKFISNVSHELKTPIAIINNYSEMLLDDNELSDVQHKFVTKIKNNIDRMIKLIDDILYISRLNDNFNDPNIKLEYQNLKEIINNSIEQCSINAISKNIQIIFEDQTDIELKTDASLLQQAFVNLLNNAINYSDKNKTVKIQTSTQDKNVLIKISDEGFGIAENDLKNIFKRFYRVDKSRSRKTGGAGLGLSIVEKIINYHNGQISIESELSKGTTIFIKLPY